MRLQYRIWDNKNKRYFEPTYEGHLGKIEELNISPSGELMKRTIDKSIHESMFRNQYDVEYETTVKDISNNLIFENDVVRLDFVNVGDTEYTIGIVTFSEGQWWVDNGLKTYPLWSEVNELRIIGNVHGENLFVNKLNDLGHVFSNMIDSKLNPRNFSLNEEEVNNMIRIVNNNKLIK